MKSRIAYLEELVDDMSTGFVTFGQREFDEYDYEGMDAWEKAQKDFTSKLLSWRTLRLKNAKDKEFLKLTIQLYNQAFYWFNKRWLVSKATDKRYDKIEADVKSIKADIKRILLSLNLLPTAQEQSQSQTEDEQVSKTPPQTQLPKSDFRGIS